MIWFVLVVIIILLIGYLLVAYVTIMEVRDLKDEIEDNEFANQKWNSEFINAIARNTTDIVNLKKDHDQIQKNSDSCMANLKEIVRLSNEQVKNGKLLNQIWIKLFYPNYIGTAVRKDHTHDQEGK